MKHLWEIKHPYYCSETNYFASEDKTVRKYKSWQEFMDEFGTADFNMNLLFRFDWQIFDEDDEDAVPSKDIYYRDGKLLLFWMGQRKGLFQTSIVDVCQADEPEALKFLKPRFEHMMKLWEPFN